jgi:hypothetical protein
MVGVGTMKIGANGSKRWVEAFGGKFRAQTPHGRDFYLSCLFLSQFHTTIRHIDTSFDQGRSEVSSGALSSSKTTSVACCLWLSMIAPWWQVGVEEVQD